MYKAEEMVVYHSCMYMVEYFGEKEMTDALKTRKTLGQRIKMNCLLLFYFWCKQNFLNEAEAMINLIESSKNKKEFILGFSVNTFEQYFIGACFCFNTLTFLKEKKKKRNTGLGIGSFL